MNLPHEHKKKKPEFKILTQMPMVQNFDIVADLLKNLSDPTRLQIFWILYHAEECIINLAAILGTTIPTISRHIQFLNDNNLIVTRKVEKEVFYKAADNDIARLLHQILEVVMESACPLIDEKKCDYCDCVYDVDDVSSIHDYLIDNLHERVTIEELSHKFHMNPTTLKNKFKSVYGNSIAAHVKEHRIEKAADLLLESNMSISEIAELVGYTSQSKFSASFFEVYGMLPLEYRKKYSH